ncbi:MAG: polysaccharide biosynthesis protein [Sporolactobacillus sp.]|jgi:O-antigen/teichoic acid export membrane protein|nr:polysaccharide biosynthesis protein [Sporolactobacillus sp.]
MAASKMIRGTLILTIASFVSRFLGIFFMIPYYWLTGLPGSNLYQYAYTPYAIMLSISTLGLPLAVSKFVSKYNALGDYESGRRLLKSGIVLMFLTGIVGFLILFLGAPKLAELNNISSRDFDHVVLVIRVVSIAIIIVPVMSLMRGYFQGFQSMGPTAVSQVVEQVVRVAFILVSSYIVMNVVHGSVVTAAALATFAAFVGAVGGLYVMMHYWVIRRRKIGDFERRNRIIRRHKMPLLSMYKELVTYAVPFVAVGIAMNLYQLIDQPMTNHYLHYSYEVKQAVITDLTMNDQKLVMIPVVLATSLAVSAVPALIVSYAKGDFRGVNEKITQAFQLVLFLTVPAAFGLSALGYMVHGLLYGSRPELLLIGGRVLTWYAPTALLFALFQVGASILQGINRQMVTIVALGTGVLLKILTNPICMKLFGMVGPIIATDLGYSCSFLIIALTIRRVTGFEFSMIAQQLVHIVCYTAMMLLAVNAILLLFGGRVPTNRGLSLIIVILCVVLGAAVYLLPAKWTGLLRKVMGTASHSGALREDHR